MTDAERLQQSIADAEQKSQQLQHELRATEARLRTDPRCREFFAPYPPEQQEKFIQSYLKRKAHYLTEGPNLARYRLHQAIEYQEDAYERLFDIQQKKLFDLQVEWRAGRLQLPGIRVHQNFEHWQENIHRCPFLPPITAEEVARYRHYLATEAHDLGFQMGIAHDYWEWQNYDQMRERLQAPAETTDADTGSRPGVPYPDWYAYVDRQLGRPAGYPFATEPDVRGERQEAYLNLYREEKRAERAAQAATQPSPPLPDPRPDVAGLRGLHEYDSFADAPDQYLSDEDGAYDYHFSEFTRRFHPDADHIFALRRAMRRMFSTSYNAVHERVEQSVELLTDTNDLIPVEAHPDWRQAVTQAAINQHRRLLLKALPAVWADYEFRIATGLQPAKPDQFRAYHDDDDADEDDEQQPHYLEAKVLRGRELAGEPRDWAF